MRDVNSITLKKERMKNMKSELKQNIKTEHQIKEINPKKLKCGHMLRLKKIST